MRKTCLDLIYKIAKKDKKVIFIGSDLGPGVLNEFKKKIPSRFFMEGVSEQFIVGLSAGLAIEGYKPYINTISTFLTRRCYEQIVVDLCMHNLPVKLIGNGGGLVYAPLGPTHQATEDIAILRVLPNISIIAPSDAVEMEELMKQTVNLKGPLYVRIAKGGDKIIHNKKDKIRFGKGLVKIKPKKQLIVSTGVMTQVAMEAAEKINRDKKHGCGVIHLGTIKPLDEKILKKYFKTVDKILTLEEGVENGGFGSAILETTNKLMPENCHKIKILGLKNKFEEKYGTQEELLKKNKLTVQNVIKKLI